MFKSLTGVVKQGCICWWTQRASFLGEGEWKCKKHGPERRRQWRKLHIGIDAQTLQIRAITVTSNNVSDAAVIPDLLGQLPADEVLKRVTTDGAYDTQPLHQAVIGRGAIRLFRHARMLEYAKALSLCIAMQAIAAYRQFGRKIWKIWSGHHRRSLVETKMNCIKRLGERVMSRTLSASQ